MNHEYEREPNLESPESAYERYAKRLGLDEKDLAGKKILDVGSNENQFEQYLEEKYPGTEVVSLDAHFSPKISVQADGRDIPFKDGSFDVIVCHASLISEELMEAMDGLVAALKPGGEIRFGPIMEGPVYDDMQKFINNLPKEVSAELVPAGVFEMSQEKEKRFYMRVKKL